MSIRTEPASRAGSSSLENNKKGTTTVEGCSLIRYKEIRVTKK